jgi:hypothetical protein
MEARNENLRELIKKFMDAKNAQTYLEDIEAGERILREHPAPRPDDMLLANIKANMAMHKMPQRTVTFKKRVLEALAVAASITVIAVISFRSFDQTPPVPQGESFYTTGISLLPEGFWTHEDQKYTSFVKDLNDINTQIVQIEKVDDDYDSLVLEEFENQIEQLKNNLMNIETREENYSSTFGIVEELENQLDELSGSFWQDDYSNAGILE